MGYEIVPSWRMEQLAFERHLKTLFAAYAIDTVFDVGANTGRYRDFLRATVGFQGTIHSFEPVSALAEGIAARARADTRWRIHKHALGVDPGEREINVYARSTFSSFLEPRADVGSEFAEYTTLAHKEVVEIKRLDDVVGVLVADPSRLYLKIDTQGFDLEVLRGGREALRGIRALQFELAIQPIYQNVPNYREVLRQLEEWGFSMSGLFPVVSDDKLRAVEVDCVMVASR